MSGPLMTFEAVDLEDAMLQMKAFVDAYIKNGSIEDIAAMVQIPAVGMIRGFVCKRGVLVYKVGQLDLSIADQICDEMLDGRFRGHFPVYHIGHTGLAMEAGLIWIDVEHPINSAGGEA